MERPSYKPEDINQLPDQPGVYRYYNEDDKLIYVGKAKSLKKRVSSYFNKSHSTSYRITKLVREIRRIEITLTNNEFDALLLENNLIKNEQPRYNVNLRDDKSYPYICVTNERFPRIFSTRHMEPGTGRYFGPFASVRGMNNVLNLLKSLYHIRTCKYDLSDKNIKAGKFKVCLEYHINNCKGPCEGLQSEEDYNKDIEAATNVLKGNLTVAKNHFSQAMKEAAENWQYEKAQQFKEKLDLLHEYQAKSQVVNPQIADTDVVSVVSDDKSAFVNFMKVSNGSVILTKTVELKKKLNESDEELLAMMTINLRQEYESHSSEILSNKEFAIPDDKLKVIVPKIGDKRKLVDLSVKNAIHYKQEKAVASQSKQEKENRVLQQMQNDLQLQELPFHIECFDNSNIQGSNPVASMVCFKNGKAAKKEYRKFNIKTVEGPDDFGSMKEIVSRRYSRMMEEGSHLPNLIIIDGGKGQLNAACEALKELGIYGKIPIIGIAKKLEEIYYPEDQYPIHLNRKSETLQLIQRIRDEAHRFAITFHRQKRSGKALQSKLEDVQGIGKQTATKLLQKYHSIKRIKEADMNELTQLVGEKKAKTLKKEL